MWYRLSVASPKRRIANKLDKIWTHLGLLLVNEILQAKWKDSERTWGFILPLPIIEYFRNIKRSSSSSHSTEVDLHTRRLFAIGNPIGDELRPGHSCYIKHENYDTTSVIFTLCFTRIAPSNNNYAASCFSLCIMLGSLHLCVLLV